MSVRLPRLAFVVPSLALLAFGACSKSTEGDNMYQPMEHEFEIRSMRTVDSGVEIEIVCRGVLYVGGLYHVLNIGAQQFDESHPPDDGDRHAVVFPVGAADFEALEDGAEVAVCWGPCVEGERPEEQPGMSGYAGTLDKSLLDR